MPSYKDKLPIQTTINFDTIPTIGSTNAVTSGGIYNSLLSKQDVLTNPVTGTGTAGQVAYFSGTSAVTGSANLFWDNANNRLGVGTNAPITDLHIKGGVDTRLRISSSVTPREATLTYFGAAAVFTIITDNIFRLQCGNNFVFFANNSGSVGINTVSPLAGTKLHVLGSTLLQGLGTTSATTALLVQNSTSSELFKVLDNGTWNFNGDGVVTGTGTGSSTNFAIRNSSSQNIMFFRNDNYIGFNNNASLWIQSNPTNAGLGVEYTSTTSRRVGISFFLSSNTTSGNIEAYSLTGNFNPTSGTSTITAYNISPTINQTGGANGITRGVYVNPTLTAASDWRGIESVASSNANHTLLKLRNATVDVFTVKADSKIGFFNATPVDQRQTTSGAATLVGGGGTALTDTDTFDGYTLATVVKALRDLGLLA